MKSSPKPSITAADQAVLSLADVARDHIMRTLELVDGNKAVAARLLGVSRRALYRQLERHGLHHRVPARRGAAIRDVEPQQSQ